MPISMRHSRTTRTKHGTRRRRSTSRTASRSSRPVWSAERCAKRLYARREESPLRSPVERARPRWARRRRLATSDATLPQSHPGRVPKASRCSRRPPLRFPRRIAPLAAPGATRAGPRRPDGARPRKAFVKDIGKIMTLIDRHQFTRRIFIASRPDLEGFFFAAEDSRGPFFYELDTGSRSQERRRSGPRARASSAYRDRSDGTRSARDPRPTVVAPGRFLALRFAARETNPRLAHRARPVPARLFFYLGIPVISHPGREVIGYGRDPDSSSGCWRGGRTRSSTGRIRSSRTRVVAAGSEPRVDDVDPRPRAARRAGDATRRAGAGLQRARRPPPRARRLDGVSAVPPPDARVFAVLGRRILFGFSAYVSARRRGIPT